MIPVVIDLRTIKSLRFNKNVINLHDKFFFGLLVFYVSSENWASEKATPRGATRSAPFPATKIKKKNHKKIVFLSLINIHL